MIRITSYAPKAFAMLGAAGITALTLYVHAVDRSQLGAPGVALHPTLAHAMPATPAASPERARATVTLVATRQE